MVSKKEHKVLKIEHILGSRVSWSVLRILVSMPYMGFGLTEISQLSGSSKSNVLRILGKLTEENVIMIIGSERKKVFRINSSHPLYGILSNIFMWERKANLDPSIKNILDLFLEGVKDSGAKAIILFGSYSKGTQTERSDIDLLIVEGEREKIKNTKFNMLPEARLETHFYSEKEFRNLSDFVVLDALLNGIVIHGFGYVANVLKGVRSFPKSYILWRISKAKECIRKMEKTRGEARKYFENIAEVTIGEIDNLIRKKETIPKRYERVEDLKKKIKKIEEGLAKMGDELWLI